MAILPVITTTSDSNSKSVEKYLSKVSGIEHLIQEDACRHRCTTQITKKGQMERSVANLHNRKWDIRYERMVWDFVVTIPADPKIVHTIQQGFSHTYKPMDEGVFEHDCNDPPLQDTI